MSRKILTTGFVVLALAAPGCSSSDGGDDAAAQQPSGVVEIGPEGGELVDNGSNGFPGFSLKIPPGALAAKTKVSFAGVLDATPLPPGAERVGVQVRLMPQGTTLAKPALLTVPVDPGLRAAYENPASECKVWAREGDGWKRLEAVATTEDSVTVEVSSFHAAAAAGVILRVAPLSCGAACKNLPEISPAEPACTDPSGYCISKVDIVAPARVISFVNESIAFVRNKLFYLRLFEGSNGAPIEQLAVSPQSYDLDTHETTTYPSLTISTGGSAVMLSQIAVASNDDVWLAVGGNGNVRFPKTGLVQVFDAPGTELGGLTRPEAVTVSSVDGADVVVRYTSNMSFATLIRSFFSKNGTRTSQLFLGSFSEQVAAQPREGVPATAFLRSNRQGFCAVAITAPNAPINCGGSPAVPRAVGNVSSYGAFALSRVKMVSPPLAAAVPAFAGGGAALRQFGDIADISLTFPNGVGDMAFDNENRLYAINTGRAEIMLWDKATPAAVTILPLTSALPGSALYSSRLPRRIFQVPGKNELIVVTVGADGAAIGLAQGILRIRRAQ